MAVLKRVVVGLLLLALVGHGIWAEVRLVRLTATVARAATAWDFLITPVGKTETGKVVVVGDVLAHLVQERIARDAAAFAAAEKGK